MICSSVCLLRFIVWSFPTLDMIRGPSKPGWGTRRSNTLCRYTELAPDRFKDFWRD
jgi:hypothetical protein